MRNEDCILGVPTGREERKRKAHMQKYRGRRGGQDPKMQVSESQGWKWFQGGMVTFIRLLGSQGE